MAIESTLVQIQYVGNGASREYVFPFPVLEPEHLKLLVADKDGAAVGYTYGQHYSVTVNTGTDNQPISARIILAQVLPAEWTMLVQRDMPIIQSIRMKNFTGYFPEAVEKGLDYLTMVCQQLGHREASFTEEMLKQLGIVAVKIDDLTVWIGNIEKNTTQAINSLTTTTTNLSNRVGTLEGETTGLSRTVLNLVAKDITLARDIREVERVIDDHTTARDPHPQYLRKENIGDFVTDGIWEADENGDIQIKWDVTVAQTGYHFVDANGDIALF